MYHTDVCEETVKTGFINYMDLLNVGIDKEKARQDTIGGLEIRQKALENIKAKLIKRIDHFDKTGEDLEEVEEKAKEDKEDISEDTSGETAARIDC